MAFNFNASRQLFNSAADEFVGVERDRADIVTCGRLLMMEHNGRAANAMAVLRKEAEPYRVVLNGAKEGEASYADTNRNLQFRLLQYCAKRACSLSGETAPATMDEFRREQRKYFTNATFLATLAGIIRDVVTPLLPMTMSNSMGWLAETVNVPMGQTYELDVQSNDVFLFQDDSWGASRSKPANHLYSKPITINPTLRTAKATVKWYQLVANDADLGRFFNSIAAGMYSKVTALWINALVTASTNTAFVPAALSVTNSSANWVTLASKLAMVNRTYFRNIIGVGHPAALTKALPSGVTNGASVALDSALATMLGVDWARYGYLGEYMGVRLMPIEDAIVPGTQNTTITGMVPTDKIYLLATNGYKPIYVGIEEGTPITIQLDPSQTADMSIDIMVSISIDAVPVFASKIGIVTA